jgi:hypothetical protein
MLPSGLDEDVARISIPSTGRPESLAEAQIIKLGDSVVRLRAVAEDRRLADQPLGALLQAPSGAVEGIRAHHPLRCAEVTEWRSDIHGLEMAMRCSTWPPCYVHHYFCRARMRTQLTLAGATRAPVVAPLHTISRSLPTLHRWQGRPGLLKTSTMSPWPMPSTSLSCWRGW